MNTLKLILIFVLMFVLGLIGFIGTSVSRSKAMNAQTDFNELQSSEFKSGMYVRGTVYEVLDEYAYETSDNHVSARYYIVPIAGTYEDEYPQYVTVSTGNSDVQNQADLLMQQTWNYYDYGTEPAVWNEFEIIGKVSKLEPELLDYLYDWFMYGDYSATRAEYSKYICPYEISVVSTSGLLTGAIMFAIMGGIGAIGLAVFIIIYIKAHRNCY
ncbi:MAG: hypothetical protein E7478_07925 [Ruminococcaceae bacterium]|nr:hypothetical protein [Oscillospiraceae bacterium]